MFDFGFAEIVEQWAHRASCQVIVTRLETNVAGIAAIHHACAIFIPPPATFSFVFMSALRCTRPLWMPILNPSSGTPSARC